MLYQDYRLPLPAVLPGPDYSIRCQPYKGDRSKTTVVLYTGKSRRDKETHKLVHAKRVTIGMTFTEDGNVVFIPNEQYFNYFSQGEQPPVLSQVRGRGRPAVPKPEKTVHKDGAVMQIGFSLAWQYAARQLGLTKILNTAFGADLTAKILAVAAFYAYDNERGLTMLERFVRTQMCFTEAALNSQRACELFASIKEEQLTDFFRLWLERMGGKDFCFYDVTSVSYTGDGITEVAWGYNRDKEELPQVNLGLFVSSKTNLPLFYCNYNGGINDFTNFPYVMNEAKFMGLKGRITIVGDRIFSDAESASAVYHKGYGLLVGVQVSKFADVREQILGWQNNPSINQEITASPGEDITSSSCSFTLKDIPGVLHMYKQDGAVALEIASVKGLVKEVNKQISAASPSGTDKRPGRRIRQLFDVETVKEKDRKTRYKITPNDEKVMDAIKLCGTFAIFTTELNMDSYDCLNKYRAKDACEKNFANLKNELIGERMLVHSSDAWHGKLFVLFISLIVRTFLHNKLKSWIRDNRSSLRAAFAELAELKCRKNGERWILKEALTKPQKEIASALGLPLDYLKTTALN